MGEISKKAAARKRAVEKYETPRRAAPGIAPTAMGTAALDVGSGEGQHDAAGPLPARREGSCL